MATANSTNIDPHTSARDKEIQRTDVLERRTQQARTVLDLLLMSMNDDEGWPTEEVVHDAVWAAKELLTV